MTRTTLLASALLLCAPLASRPAAAQFFSCDQIGDAVQWGNCNQAEAQRFLPPRYAGPATQQVRPTQARPQQPVARAPPPTSYADRTEIFKAVMQMRREDCWDWAVATVQYVAPSAGKFESEGMRHDFVLGCLKQTHGIGERIDDMLRSGRTSPEKIWSCAPTISSSGPRDENPRFAIEMLEACLKRG